MRVDLPSGAWVEFRDDLMAQDRFDVQAAATVAVSDSTGQTTLSPLAMLNQQRNALLARVITGWSLAEQGIPIPANNPGGAAIIGAALTLRDYNALETAIEPLFAEIRGRADGPN